MSRAVCLLPDGPNYRRADFLAGLYGAGLSIHPRIDRPQPGDVLVIWNRSAASESEARRFEAAGARVLVAENGYFGKHWLGCKWFALAWDHHAGAGQWPNGGPERWDGWGVELKPWRQGSETVILGQRGIGEPGIASPHRWAETVQQRMGGRIRKHPGALAPAVSLVDDLKNAASVVTWHSSSALQALQMGIPVWYGFDRWIGKDAANPLAKFGSALKRDDAARLSMFRRLAWAMWTAEEVKSGDAFKELLCVS